MDTILNARIDEAVDRLSDEFKGIFSPETVSKCAFESLEAFERSRLVEFVPLLTIASPVSGYGRWLKRRGS